MEDWGFEASLLIKRRMKARAWGYRELAEALKSQGVKRSAAVINRRVNRGDFPAGFLLACLYVLENEVDSTAGTTAKAGSAQVSNEIEK